MRVQLNRVGLFDAAAFLGNITQTAEKRYEPWVKSRQIALEKSIEKAWRL